MQKKKCFDLILSLSCLTIMLAPLLATISCDSWSDASSSLSDNAAPRSIYTTLVKVLDRVDDKQVEIVALMTGSRDLPRIFPLSCVQKIGGEVLGTDLVGMDRLVKGLGWKFDASAATVKYDNVTSEAQQKFLRAAGWGFNPELKCRYEDGEMSLRLVRYQNGNVRYYALFKNKLDEQGKLVLFNLGCKGLLDAMGLTQESAIEMSPETLRLDYTTKDLYDISCIDGTPMSDNRPCWYNGAKYSSGVEFDVNEPGTYKKYHCDQGQLQLKNIVCQPGYTKASDASGSGCYANCGAISHGSVKSEYNAQFHGKYDFVCRNGTFYIQRALICDGDYTADDSNLCGLNCGQQFNYPNGKEAQLPLKWGKGHGEGFFLCNNGDFKLLRVARCDSGYHPQGLDCAPD